MIDHDVPQQRTKTYHAKLRVNSGSQVLRQLVISGPDRYVWSACNLLAKHYESTGLTTRLSRWWSMEYPPTGTDRETETNLLAGDDLPW